MRSKFLVAVLLLAFSYPALAVELTGAISGTIRDAQGGPVPGVTVTVTSPVLQGSRTAVSRADGTFIVGKLPPGPGYKATFEISGFRAVEITPLEISTGKETPANPKMELSSVTAEVTVTSERPTVDVTQTNTQQNFSADYLKRIPVGSNNRSYQAVLQEAPGVTQGTGNPNVMGGNILENSYQIDGVNTTDTVTHTFSMNFNFDAIQEISLQTSSYLPEYGRATGGLINVITKSGGNRFSGTADIRYSNNDFTQKGDHFDPKVSESRNTPWGITLGGPILLDKVWFFGNLQRPDNFTTPVAPNATVAAQIPTGPSPRKFLGWNDGGKITFTATPSLSGFVSVQDSLATIGGVSNSNLYRPEATSTQRQRSRIYDGVFDAIIQSNWSAELQVARFESHLETGPTFSDINTSQWVNTGGGSVRYDAYNNVQASDRNRNLIAANTSYSLEGFGTHQIKVGGDYNRDFFPSINYTTGSPSDPSFCPAGLVCGATFTFNGFDASGARRPVQQVVSERQGATDRKGRSFSGYVQDQWRLFSHLTVNAGVRYERNDYYNNIGVNALHLDKFMPRFGAAYDLFGDGTNVFRASYGQYYVDAALTFDRLFDSGIVSAISRTFNWNATTQSWVFVRQTGGTELGSPLIDPSLKPTYDDQFNAAFERQIFPGASASVGYIYKKTHDIYEDSFVCQECNDFWITNFPGRDVLTENPLRKNYYAYTTQFQYSTTNRRLFVNANYVYSKSRGSIDASVGQYAGEDFDTFPDNYINRFGYLGDDARHRVKLLASYLIPKIETQIAVNYYYRTGLPYNVTHASALGGNIFDVPRGTDRTPPLTTLDLELQKRFDFGPVGIVLIGSVYNAINSEQPLTYFGVSTSPTTLRTPSSYQRPRNYEVGFRAEF